MTTLALFLVVLTGATAGLVLVVRGLLTAVRGSERTPGSLLRAAALLAGGGALALYAWGTAHALLAVLSVEDGGTGSWPPRPCLAAGPDMASHVDGYRISYLPLRFECHLSTGGTYATASVPAYVNPAFLGLTGVACVILGTAAARRVEAVPARKQEA
ncbi:hypothetical protein KQY30_02015 [Streptomyces sp. GMY02]|uniref:hypothetical protein n=1 Tax=Streptomyces sp. GMY02 TaxID=1333528 RepID=UPI001C2BF5C4|nr:hypothetical protein [Streptomyces sp. GMY02]QXE33249.1 hypothetical protein KQY30_02015 [Streptomyces sp. GMY02]